MNERDIEAIQNSIHKRYAQVASSAKGRFKYSTGKEGAIALDYDKAVVESFPKDAIEAFCGVGNPFLAEKIAPASIVLDIGCGAGFDLFVASVLAGPGGKVCGIDLTREMVEAAQKNLNLAGSPNFQVLHAGAEQMPFDSEYFDVVISNGALNLSPAKEKCFREIYRVLKAGGRLQFADMTLKADLPEETRGNLNAWSH